MHMKANLHDVASGRATFYEFLITVFELLPDEELLGKIRDGVLENFLSSWRELGDRGFRSGLDNISSYRFLLQEKADDDVLKELSVDRTKILRGTGHVHLKPPYEGLYRKGAGFGDSVLAVKQFYRKAGLVPDERVSDSADYLFVELDFMKQLCLREEALRLREEEGAETIAGTIALQEEFLRLHPGDWVGEFCSAVEKYASTDFYRGSALILDAYIRVDRKYLGSLVRQ
jgi:putative dimethyl sulfoxide reductase chaperone